jgi:hypothetical protein
MFGSLQVDLLVHAFGGIGPRMSIFDLSQLVEHVHGDHLKKCTIGDNSL